MRKVGVRELRAKASRILCRVREKQEPIDVTYHGHVIACIIPVVPPPDVAENISAVWTDMDQLASEIGRYRKPRGKSAAKLVNEGRERQAIRAMTAEDPVLSPPVARPSVKPSFFVRSL